jgi:hypothetical protein
MSAVYHSSLQHLAAWKTLNSSLFNLLELYATIIYANVVPSSAIYVFSKYFKLLGGILGADHAAKFSSAVDKMGDKRRIWSFE